MVGQCKVGVRRVECRVDQSKIGFSNGVEVGRRLSREGCADEKEEEAEEEASLAVTGGRGRDSRL